MNAFDQINWRAMQELDRIRRIEQGMGIDPFALSRFNDLWRRQGAAHWAFEQLSHNPSYRLDIENAKTSALTEVARSANLRSLEILNRPQSAVREHLDRFSKSWAERARLFQEPPDLAIQSAIDSHMSRISGLAILAESSLARFKWDEVGSIIRIPESGRLALRDEFLGFSRAYESLMNSLSKSEAGIVSLPPIASELAAREFFLGARLVKSVSVVIPQDELEEEGEEIEQEINLALEDELQSMVAQLDPELVAMIKGARNALASHNPDRARHLLTSYRELCTHVLHRLSPDEEIKKWSTSSDDYANGRPTRKSRLRYICRNINHGPFAGFMDRDIETMVTVFDLLNKGTHEVSTAFNEQQLLALRVKAESAVHFMLMIAQRED
jgi:hypothetical protein